MKKIAITLALALVAGITHRAMAAITANSAHDFSGSYYTAYNTVGNPISGTTYDKCNACHVPHNASAASSYLWGTQAPVTNSFTLFDGTTGAVDETSRKCLSCHDGAISMDGVGAAMESVSANLGNDLQNDHPVNKTWTEGGDMIGTASTNLTAGWASGSVVSCATCHDPHSADNTNNLVRYTTNICLECHAK